MSLPIADDACTLRDVAEQLERPSLMALLLTFLKIGVTAFGGASRPLMYLECVQSHRWLRDKDFLTGFAVAQVLPGANAVNLALYIGHCARGALGAVVAVLGYVTPAFCIVLLMVNVYRTLNDYSATHFVLLGVAGAGVAATISTGIRMATKLDRDWMTLIIALVVFVSVGVFGMSMVPVVIIAIPASFSVAWSTDPEMHRG